MPLAGTYKQSVFILHRVQNHTTKRPSHHSIPVVIEKASDTLPDLPQSLYWVPDHYTIYRFVEEIVKDKFSPGPARVVYFTVKDKGACDACSSIKTVWRRCRDSDGALYVEYSDQRINGNAVKCEIVNGEPPLVRLAKAVKH